MEDYSKDFIDYIKRFEDFKDTAYNLNNEKWPDGSLKYTIGYGTTVYADGTPVKKGDKITKEAAEAAIPVYLNSKVPHIKEYITNWDKLPQQVKEGIFSIVYRGGGLRKSPKFAKALNDAYQDGWMTTEEYQNVLSEMSFSHAGNLQDRMQRNAALIGGMYDYADNPTINYATTHRSPYQNYNNNVFYKGNKWNIRWEDAQHLNQSPANYVERLKDPNRKSIDLGNGQFGTHLMSYSEQDGKYIMYPNIQEVKSYPWYNFLHIGTPNKELVKFEGKEAFNRAIQTGDTVHIQDPWTAEHYKQHYPGFKTGGELNYYKFFK